MDLSILLKGLLILIAFQLGGEVITAWFALPFSGAIIGMGLLLLFLIAKGGIPTILSRTSSFILPYIPLFLMPICVGAVAYWPLIKEEWVGLTIALVISTIASIIMLPYIMGFALRLFTPKNVTGLKEQSVSKPQPAQKKE